MTPSSVERQLFYYTKRYLLLGLLSVICVAVTAQAQILAPHAPLRILIVSDEVNPHGLAPEELTQPGELAATLLALSGLSLDESEPDAVLEIATNDIHLATAAVALGPDDPSGYDVLIYFAHRIPDDGPDDLGDQDDFVAAVESYLAAGGGVISFHHGIYETAGKAAMQSILGGAATGSVLWDITDGQNVISLVQHFVTEFSVTYPGTVTYADPANAIPSDLYPSFNNTPDEHYPNFAFEPDAEQIEILLGSDYGSGSHVLAYTHHREAWEGIVFVYQPGEHQPTALEPGNNLQILLNAIVYVAQYADSVTVFADGFESGSTSAWSP